MPKSREQYDEMRQKSREAIIKAALSLFVSKGYHATSIGMIAKEAGVAIGLMYHYFKSKDELLTEIMEEYFGSIRERAMEEMGRVNAGDARHIIDALFSAIEQSGDSWRLIITVMFQPDVAESAKMMIEGLFQHQQGLYLEHFRRAGVLRPQESANTLGAVMHGAMLAYALSGNSGDLKLVRDHVIEKLLTSGV